VHITVKQSGNVPAFRHSRTVSAWLNFPGRQEIFGGDEANPNDMAASAAEGKTVWRLQQVQI